MRSVVNGGDWRWFMAHWKHPLPLPSRCCSSRMLGYNCRPHFNLFITSQLVTSLHSSRLISYQTYQIVEKICIRFSWIFFTRFTIYSRGADLNQRFYHRDGSFEATLWYSIDRLRTLEIFYFLFFYNINFQFRMIPFGLILTVFFVIFRIK